MTNILQRLRANGVITIAEWDTIRSSAADEIERLTAALRSVQDWLDTLPNAANIAGFPKDDVDAAMLPYWKPKP